MQRTALDMAVCSLYFNVLENISPLKNSYNKIYSEWDIGMSDTPRWGEMKKTLISQTSIELFNEKASVIPAIP